MRYLLRYLPPRLGGHCGVRACSRSISPGRTQCCPTGLGGGQCGPGPLGDQLPLLLHHGGVDPHHQVIGTRHARRPDRVTLLQQLRQRVGTAGDTVQPGGDKRRIRLPAAHQHRREARAAIVLATGDGAAPDYQRRSICGGEGARTSL
jgi:hypothetical protein